MVVATMPPTLTSAFLPNTTPLGFTKMTWPFALTAPSIMDFVAPFTMLSVDALALGWLKLTVASLPTLNEFHPITARCDVWFTFKVFRF